MRASIFPLMSSNTLTGIPLLLFATLLLLTSLAQALPHGHRSTNEVVQVLLRNGSPNGTDDTNQALVNQTTTEATNQTAAQNTPTTKNGQDPVIDNGSTTIPFWRKMWSKGNKLIRNPYAIGIGLGTIVIASLFGGLVKWGVEKRARARATTPTTTTISGFTEIVSKPWPWIVFALLVVAGAAAIWYYYCYRVKQQSEEADDDSKDKKKSKGKQTTKAESTIGKQASSAASSMTPNSSAAGSSTPVNQKTSASPNSVAGGGTSTTPTTHKTSNRPSACNVGYIPQPASDAKSNAKPLGQNPRGGAPGQGGSGVTTTTATGSRAKHATKQSPAAQVANEQQRQEHLTPAVAHKKQKKSNANK